MKAMSTSVDTAAYLESLSRLSQRGFISIQDAMQAILQLVAEQLQMRSCFVTRLMHDSEQLEVLAVYNSIGGCDIQMGTIVSLAPLLQSLIKRMHKAGEPTPVLLEDIHNDSSLSGYLGSIELSPIGCYIGVPIVLADGSFYGVLSAMDRESKKLSSQQAKLMLVLARLLATQIERDQQLAMRKWAETELASAIDSLQEANQHIELVDRLQNDFVVMVNHEFRTALTGIQGFSELMRDEHFSFEEIKEYATDINADARRLSTIITELLDLERLRSGQALPNLEQLDLNGLIMDVVDQIRPTTTAHTFRFQLDEHVSGDHNACGQGEQEGSPLRGDRDKLSKVVANLVSNAVRYSPAGGEIFLTSQLEGDAVRVSVRDQGVGIPSHAFERIFEPYNRIEAGTSRYIKGTGLGLPVVRQIIQMHGGQVWVESIVGQGSTFHFTVQLALSS
ncbi:MAG: hypothetical protein NVSMB27_12000 [Ktedonobacteraceae bacterium]